MTPTGLRKVGLVLTGIVMGLLGLAIGVWFYLQAARIDEVRTNIGERVRLARDAIEHIDIIEEDAFRIALRDVALFDEEGDTILAAPTLTMTLDATTITGDGAIEFYDVEIDDPFARLIQSPGGEWNFANAVGMTAAGEAVETEDGRPLAFRGVTISNGRLILAIPEEEQPAEESAFLVNLPRAVISGTPYQIYNVDGVQAELASFTMDPETGWRAELAALSADIERPEIRIAQMAGSVQQAGDDAVEFDLATLQWGNSEVQGAGTVTFVEEGLLYDVQLAFERLQFPDIQPLFPTLPDEGSARFALGVESIDAKRLALNVTDMVATSGSSRMSGGVQLAAGGGTPFALMAADLTLDPLNLQTLVQLGFAEEFPVLGEVRGRITTENAPSGRAVVDLTAILVPAEDPEALPSTILATGDIQLSGPEGALSLDGLTLSARPLHLASFRSLAPARANLMRGDITGSVTLAGTLSDVRFRDGELTYVVGDAPPTRLNDLTGRISTSPELSYEIEAVASPLALATLTELFPALPFEEATVSGPVRLVGDQRDLDLSASLSGTAGGIEVEGSLAFGEPMRFDINGSVRAFAAGMILRPELPTTGPLTGSFALNGTTQQFSFDVDLTQAGGRFDLAGSVTMGSEEPVFQVAGQVNNFRLGSLMGSPELFPDPMSGTVAVEGGDGTPYVFDFDLAGAVGQLDLAGFYSAGEIPSYEARGNIIGLDLSRIPFAAALPPTLLTGAVDIRGRGITPETIEGSFGFDLTNSTVSGLPLDMALGRVDISGGVMVIDTLDIALEETQLTAVGSWGLTTPAPEPLRFAFNSPDLTFLRRMLAPTDLVPPEVAGSIQATGQVAGSFRYPEITTDLTARSLRYLDWTASNIEASVEASRSEVGGWSGEGRLEGDVVVLAGIETLQTVRVEANGNEGSLAFGLFAARNEGSDLTFSGLLELEGIFPRGIGLQAMALRLDGVGWQLLNPSRIQYTASQGLLVENLALQRTGQESGVININGAIPPSGIANFTLNAVNFDLADLNRLTPNVPVLEGMLSMEALLTGPVEDPELTIEAQLDSLQYEGVVTERINLDALYADRQLRATGEGIIAGQRLFGLDATIPMTLRLQQMIPSLELVRTEPINVSLVADSLPLDLIAAAIPGFAEGAGAAQAQINVSGSVDEPQLAGWMRMEGGAMLVEALGARYTDIRMDLVLARNEVVVNDFSATSDGTIEVSGSVAFPAGSPARVALSASFNDFRAADNPELGTVTISGQLAALGPLAGPVLTGQIEISESTFQVPELGAAQPGLELGYTDIAELTTPVEGATVLVPPLFGDLRIDGVQVIIGESVWLESSELRVQIGGDVVVYRTGDELRVFGALQALRGTYALEISAIVREFDVISGRVQFFGTSDLNPSVDILAGYRVRGSTVGRGGDLTILVQVTGTLLSPRLQLGADTPVPISEADLISYLLFGQPSFELGGVTRSFAEQILVQEVVGGLIASELERPILRAGLCDWVRVLPGATTSITSIFGAGGGPLAGAVIECGWEIANDLFLTGQTGIGGLFGGEFTDYRVGVEWQIDDQWMWEASYGTVQRDPAFRNLIPGGRSDLQFSTELRRQWEYGLPRQQTRIDFTPEEPIPGDSGPPLPPTPVLPPPTDPPATTNEPEPDPNIPTP